MLKSSQYVVVVFLNNNTIQTITGLCWLHTKIKKKKVILLVLHTTVGLPCDTSKEINIFSKLDREMCVCFVACWSRGGRLTHGGGKGEGNRAEVRGRGTGGGITWRKHGQIDPWAAGEDDNCPPCSSLPRPLQRRAGCGIWPSVKMEKMVTLSPSCWPPVTVTQQIHHYSLATESPTFKSEYCSGGIQLRSSIFGFKGLFWYF